MNKFDELLEKLKNFKLEQDGSWDDDLYGTELWEEYFEGNYKEVASEIDIDKHRWYETSTTVLKFEDRFLGIRSVTNTYSEDMGLGDCSWEHIFFEVEEVPTVTYIKK